MGFRNNVNCLFWGGMSFTCDKYEFEEEVTTRNVKFKSLPVHCIPKRDGAFKCSCESLALLNS